MSKPRTIITPHIVKKSNHILKAIEEAIYSINRANYCNIAYGDKLIPVFYVPDKDFSVELEKIVKKWMDVLDEISLDEKHVNQEEWLEISKIIRKKIINQATVLGLLHKEGAETIEERRVQ